MAAKQFLSSLGTKLEAIWHQYLSPFMSDVRIGLLSFFMYRSSAYWYSSGSSGSNPLFITRYFMNSLLSI